MRAVSQKRCIHEGGFSSKVVFHKGGVWIRRSDIF